MLNLIISIYISLSISFFHLHWVSECNHSDLFDVFFPLNFCRLRGLCKVTYHMQCLGFYMHIFSTFLGLQKLCSLFLLPNTGCQRLVLSPLRNFDHIVLVLCTFQLIVHGTLNVQLPGILKMFSSEMTLASAWIHLLVVDLFAARFLSLPFIGCCLLI